MAYDPRGIAAKEEIIHLRPVRSHDDDSANLRPDAGAAGEPIRRLQCDAANGPFVERLATSTSRRSAVLQHLEPSPDLGQRPRGEVTDGAVYGDNDTP